MKTRSRFAVLLIALLISFASRADAQAVGAFAIEFDEAVFGSEFSGDVLIAFGPAEEAGGEPARGRGRRQREPRQSMHGWFGAPPVARFTLAGVAPGEVVDVSHATAAAHYPIEWSEVEAQRWKVQAIARLSVTGREAGLDAGDVYSDVLEIDYDSAADGTVHLILNKIVEERPFEETERVKLFEFKSPSLSKFHGHDYILRAGVLLPRDFDAARTYPVVYSVTGFGGTHTSIQRWARGMSEDSPLDQSIVVVPDASNRWGHSVFCDSDSIGPWGEALVRELIPALDKKYGGAGAEHRYVTGVSSGGWSSLWLQVAYPDDFAGCWSHVPDPIDFHDFQYINLYEPLADGSPRNMYVDENGEERPLARRNGETMLTYGDFARREHVLNPGGQIRSFEATFSPLGADGTPQRVFDVATGEIDHEAAQAWKRYDISHQLLTNWDELRGSLAGKIHVYAGEIDTFHLEGAVIRFKELAGEAGLLDEMVVEVIPGMAHQLHGPGQADMLATIDERWRATEDVEQ